METIDCNIPAFVVSRSNFSRMALSGHGAPALKDPYTDYIVSICRLYEHEFDRFCDSFESATDPKHQPGMLASSSEIDGPSIDSNTS